MKLLIAAELFGPVVIVTLHLIDVVRRRMHG
jgi:hypothetical protein